MRAVTRAIPSGTSTRTPILEPSLSKAAGVTVGDLVGGDEVETVVEENEDGIEDNEDDFDEINEAIGFSATPNVVKMVPGPKFSRPGDEQQAS